MRRSDRAIVLVIEPNPALRWILADVLSADGYGVLEAQRSADGLRIAQEHRPGAILLDLRPTLERGWELLERLRAGEETRYIPVVVITAGPEAVADRERGVDGVLPKPFDLDALLAHVARAAGRLAAPAGALNP